MASNLLGAVLAVGLVGVLYVIGALALVRWIRGQEDPKCAYCGHAEFWHGPGGCYGPDAEMSVDYMCYCRRP